jgi:hypothetical protein
MDIWIARDGENAEKLVTVLVEFGFDVPDVSPHRLGKTTAPFV